jgi:hypothetical protein
MRPSNGIHALTRYTEHLGYLGNTYQFEQHSATVLLTCDNTADTVVIRQ